MENKQGSNILSELTGLKKFSARVIHHLLNPPFENKEMLNQSDFIEYKTMKAAIRRLTFQVGLLPEAGSPPFCYHTFCKFQPND